MPHVFCRVSSRQHCAVQGEAQAHTGRRRSISWRDRSATSALPLSDEDPQGMVSRERSYQGFLPDVHEEVR